MKGIFDTHAHYDDEAFDGVRDILLTGMQEAGVDQIMTCGCNLQSSLAAQKLAEQYPFVWYAAGFHPEDAAACTETDLDTIRGFLRHPKCKAVGEIGLDYHWDTCPREIQLKRFEQQILIAKDMGLPVIIHDREAHQDTFELLKKHMPKGVLHCYSGSPEMMKELVKLGFYIGLNGVVTFKNARKAVEVAAQVPIDRLLLETDAPYLAPVPLRGKRCDSTMISYTAACIAAIRDMTMEDLLAVTNQNAREFFQI